MNRRSFLARASAAVFAPVAVSLAVRAAQPRLGDPWRTRVRRVPEATLLSFPLRVERLEIGMHVTTFRMPAPATLRVWSVDTLDEVAMLEAAPQPRLPWWRRLFRRRA